jgi:hypothetical protein
MNEFNPPILGLENYSPRTVAWKDGTVCGILNLAFDPEGAARYEAEKARKQKLRQHANVVLLQDHRDRTRSKSI